jgi:hypothetical protein
MGTVSRLALDSHFGTAQNAVGVFSLERLHKGLDAGQAKENEEAEATSNYPTRMTKIRICGCSISYR